MTRENSAIADLVSDSDPGPREIGFSVPDRYNASDILFDNLAAGRGGKTAIYCPLGNRTYAELCADASRFGHAFVSLGLQRGERILMVLNDTPAYPAAVFGALRAGFVPVLVNTLSPKDLVNFYLADSGARVAVFDADYAAIFDDDGVKGTAVETLIVVNGDRRPDASSDIRIAGDWLTAFPDALDAADTGRDDMAFWMYSSGSTGRPKGIVHLHHDMLYTALAYGRHILGITEDDICFSVPKVFFAYGFGNSITFPFWAGGAAVLYPGRAEPKAVFDCVARYKPTLFFGLPTLYTALLADAGHRDADFSSVRLCLSAAEVLAAETFAAWKDRFGHEIVEGLGSTEVLHMYLSNTPDAKKLGAAGLRLPGYETRLTDLAGNDVGPEEEGILWVRGHSNAPCYWNRPDKSAESMRDGWIWTGDRFYRDADGFHFFRGRADDLIKVSGQWVYPLEVELCLADHPDVLQCAVLGMELPDRRMTLKAFVALKDKAAAGAETTKALQDYVKAKLVPYKYPRIVEYLDNLPKTGTDKIDRQALKARPLDPET